MKFRLYLSFLLFAGILASACKSNQSISDNSKDQASDLVLENSLLWEISGNGLQENSYLFGTIHLIDEEDFFYPEKLISLDYEQILFFVN